MIQSKCELSIIHAALSSSIYYPDSGIEYGLWRGILSAREARRGRIAARCKTKFATVIHVPNLSPAQMDKPGLTPPGAGALRQRSKSIRTPPHHPPARQAQWEQMAAS